MAIDLRQRSRVVVPTETAAPWGRNTANTTASAPSYPAYPSASTANNTIVAGESRYMEDVVVEDFNAKKNSGILLPTNPMLVFSKQASAEGLSNLETSAFKCGSNFGTTYKNLWTMRGSFLASTVLWGTTDYSKLFVSKAQFDSLSSTVPLIPIPWSVTELANQQDLAMTGAYSNVGSPEFEFGVLIGELKETGKYIFDNYRRGADLIHRFSREATTKKAKLKDAAQFHEWWTGAYLEFRFSIMPIVYEIQSFLSAKLNKNVVRQTARGYSSLKAQTQYVAEAVVSSRNPHPWGKLSYIGQSVTEWTLDTRGHVTYDTVLDDFSAVMRNLGVTDYLSIKYALTTLSFLIDYFINLGNWITSLTAKVGVKQQVAGYSQELTMRKTTTVTYTGNPIEYIGFIPVSQTVIWSRKVRNPVSSPPLLPTIDVNLSITRGIDVLAIARGLLRSI